MDLKQEQQKRQKEQREKLYHQRVAGTPEAMRADVLAAIAMAAERSAVRIYQAEAGGWKYPRQVAESLAWDKKQLAIRVLGAPAKADR